jgi:hypothetical protein
VIDMRSGPEQGRIGWAPPDDCGQFDDDLAWASLGAYLNRVADTLEFGGTFDDLAPYLTAESELRWVYRDDEEIEEEGLLPAPANRSR